MAPKLLYGGGAPKSALYRGGSQGNVYRPGMAGFGGSRAKAYRPGIGGSLGIGGQPGPGIGGQPGPGIDQMTGGGMEDNMPFWFRAKAARERREKKDTGYKRRKRTGNPLVDEYQRAWDDARIENERRYKDILQGYKGRYRRGMEAMEGSEQLVKDRYGRELGQMQQDMMSRGLSGMTSKQTATGIANRAQQLGIQDIRRDRAELDARLSKDVLGFEERRKDAYPDFGNMAALAQGLGEYGGGGYGGRGGGSRYKNPGGKLKIRQQNFASTPEGLRASHRANMARQAGQVRNQPGSWHNPLTWERDSGTGAILGGSRGSRPQDVPTREEAAQAVGWLGESDLMAGGYGLPFNPYNVRLPRMHGGWVGLTGPLRRRKKQRQAGGGGGVEFPPWVDQPGMQTVSPGRWQGLLPHTPINDSFGMVEHLGPGYGGNYLPVQL